MKTLRLNSATYPMTPEEKGIYEQAGVEVICRELVEAPAETALLASIDALGVVAAKVNADMISRLAKCMVIGRYGTGTDNVDTAAATVQGIVVTIVPDFCLSEMADHTMALLLGLARKLLVMDRNTRTGEWQARVRQPVRRVAGKTLGLIGFGRIGQEVAKRAAAFDLHTVVFDPFLDHSAAERLHASFLPLAKLLAVSDFVSLHLPLTPATFHLIGEAELRMMKPSGFLINTARGAVVDENALVKALRESWIAGAGLDVFEGLAMFDPNPTVPDHPLFKMDNVILTPHSGGCSVESLEQLCHEGGQQVVSVLKGIWPAHCVNPEVVPRQSLVRTRD